MVEKHCHTLQVNPSVPGHSADIAQLHSCNRYFQDSEAQLAFHTKRKEGIHGQFKEKDYMTSYGNMFTETQATESLINRVSKTRK